MPRSRPLLLMLALPLAPRCRAGKGDLSGTVLFEGQPVACGSVVAVGADKRPRTAAIQPNGAYAFEALPAGTVSFAVHSPNPATQDQGAKDAAERNPDGAKAKG